MGDPSYRWSHGKAVCGFTRRDWERIRDCEPILRPRLETIVDSLYERLLRFEPNERLYRNERGEPDEEVYQHRVEGFKRWLDRIFKARDDEQYRDYLRDVGLIHTSHLGFEDQFVDSFYLHPTFGILFDEIMGVLGEHLEDTTRLARAASGWQRLFLLQQDLMLQAYRTPGEDPSDETKKN